MNLTDKKWIKYKGNKTKIYKRDNKLFIKNESSDNSLIFCSKLFKKKQGIKLDFRGSIISGQAVVLMLLNKNREILVETTLNSTMIVNEELFKYFIVVLKVFPNTNVEISNIDIDFGISYEEKVLEDFNNDVLVITPSYPSEEHKYMSGFVHSRVMEYKKNNIDVDVAVVYGEYKNVSKYNFEGINVTRMHYNYLRTLLQKRKYKKILIHFFDEKYYNVIQGCDIEESQLYIWVHGPETLYWDYPYFTTGYFNRLNPIYPYQYEQFHKNDKMIDDMNKRKNVRWIFVSEWIKTRSEELLKIRFNNYSVIPNIIDLDNFKYEVKNKEKMKKIFMLRRYDNINKYAVDVSVRTILELSKRPCFRNLEFNIYGTGDFYDELFKPIKGFKNVKFYKKFYTHKEIAENHRKNGIALFPTRYDAQGVSMCEAASSGLLVVASDNDAIKEFISYENGNVIETEDFVKYADFIEKISSDEKLFNQITMETRKKIEQKCSYASTVQKEIDLINDEKSVKDDIVIPDVSNNPILTIIVPAYNVEQYIVKTLKSLIRDNKEADNIEILVINDGSKDKTSQKVKEFIKQYSIGKNPIVRIIDKENGGHGSTINAGIKLAKGKFMRIIDGDDWVNTTEFENLINVLKQENSDIVITNYSEDRMDCRDSRLINQRLYDFMIPGYQYQFDDLCIENYGFRGWGPILATANIKTEKLREADFKLSEKTFYVDMEYNTFYLPVINTISYYDLDIYRYYIGRSNQSISMKSYIKNVDHHQRVISNILKFMSEKSMSINKKNYINRNIVIPMVDAHYNLLLNIVRDRKKFISFDKVATKYLSKDVLNKQGFRRKILRLTNGFFINILYYICFVGGKKWKK